MRSRYTAFTLGRIDYLQATNSLKAAKAFDLTDLDAQLAKTEWLGLTIVRTQEGCETDEVGTVCFVARGCYGGEAFTQAEASQFLRIDGEWRYDGGEVQDMKPQPLSKPKIGRNDPCPCGSGFKFKKCCG